MIWLCFIFWEISKDESDDLNAPYSLIHFERYVRWYDGVLFVKIFVERRVWRFAGVLFLESWQEGLIYCEFLVVYTIYTNNNSGWVARFIMISDNGWDMTVSDKNPLNFALVSIDSISHCSLRASSHERFIIFINKQCQTHYFSCSSSDTLIISLYHPCIQGSFSGETWEYFPIFLPNISPIIDQREIVLSLGILKDIMKKYILANLKWNYGVLGLFLCTLFRLNWAKQTPG